ncbi:MAG TPA: [acyl-carrier-protein] S-malonyltransferase [Aminobacterium sp.]|uniref:ACP S-malonyltransferase n=1 Tax=Aminobacterium TaxID=81466 RepID=UPI000ECBFCE7|nr:ACP S-malonyltransferase [Aminobacterium sp. UBA4834]HCA40064.1 [acyl-carrier-protein] S-malonyltransferase [Aminobacterium sp.]
MKYALVFPGQGAQEVGMGKSLFDMFPIAREIFQRADSSLGFHLSQLIFDGPEEKLTLTAYTQPAILTVSVAVYEILSQEFGLHFSPAYIAGHSLGEYTALVVAGALSLEDGVRLVHLRGSLMQEAVPEGEGAMAALLGLESDIVEDLCKTIAPHGECQAANYNSPGQVVISGATAFVEKAVEEAKERGARKAVLLKVSAPFHSKMMRPVANKLKEAFNGCQWEAPQWPVVANVSAQPVSTVREVQNALFHQTYMPVLWAKSVEYMASQGVDTYFELGPGTVLAGLIKRCQKGSKTYSVATEEDIKTITSLFKEVVE